MQSNMISLEFGKVRVHAMNSWLFHDNMKQSVTLWLDFEKQFAKTLVKFFL